MAFYENYEHYRDKGKILAKLQIVARSYKDNNGGILDDFNLQK